MNFYKHHLGDYDADTAHLSWDEDLAYTRMMRAYYRREKPLPTDLKDVCRLVRAVTRPQKEAVETVLKEFFVLAEDGWHQKRCDEEIAEANRKAEQNRAVGKLGGRPRKAKTVPVPPEEPGRFPDGNPEETQMVSDSKPTNNPDGFDSVSRNNPSQTPDSRQEPTEAKASDADASSDDPKARIWKLGVGLLVAFGEDEKQARAFLGRFAKLDESKLAEVIGYLAANPKIEPKAYIAAAFVPKKLQVAL